MTQEESWLLEKYNGEKTPEFFTDMERLQKGEPLGFILGHIPFLNTTIYLDSHPLIPRVETEFWVAKAIDIIKGTRKDTFKALDLCAGSGCIGVAIAKAFPHANVHFAEIDPVHHGTIRTNITKNNIDLARTDVFGGDLFEKTDPPYEFILCNPPYIPDGSAQVAVSVKEFEPSLALYGGKDGLNIITHILAQASTRLLPEGILFIEHEPEQAARLQTLAATHHMTAVTHKDQYAVPRYTILTMAQ